MQVYGIRAQRKLENLISASVLQKMWFLLLALASFEPMVTSDRKCSRAHTTPVGRLASLSVRPGSGGKVHQFAVYFVRDLFDTPENRVIPSGLTFGFGLHKLLGSSNPS